MRGTSGNGEEMTAALTIAGARVWDGAERGFVERDVLIENGVVVDDVVAGVGSGEVPTFDAAGQYVCLLYTSRCV